MVPEGWVATQIGDVATFFSGGTPSKQRAEYWGGNEPWISGKDLKTHYLAESIDKLSLSGFKAAKKAPQGASLILVRGMTLLKDFPVGYATREVAFNQDLKALVPVRGVDGLFLSFLLVASKHRIRQLVSTAGHGTGRLDTNLIQGYPVNLPPLLEQKKIAQILSTWDKAITTTEQLLANSQQQKKALMQQLLTGKKRLLDDNGVRFSGEWKKVVIGRIIKEIRKEKEVNPNSIELLTVKLHYKGVTRSGKFPNATERGRPYFRRYKGELIIGRQNLHNGGIAIVSDECNGLIASSAISSFEAGKDVDVNFILSVMSTEHFRFTVDNLAGGTGQKEIGVKDLLSLSLIVPDFEEQQKIAAVLFTTDQEISAFQQKFEALKQEKKALMQQLLTGKRRVKVDEEAA